MRQQTYQERCRALVERCTVICDSLTDAVEDEVVYKVAALAEQLVSNARDLDFFASEWDHKEQEKLG